jgi:tetratricopeptide (TPR) repeat protein
MPLSSSNQLPRDSSAAVCRTPIKLWTAAAVVIALFAAGCGRSATQYVGRGNELFDLGKFEDASINYRNAIKKDPKSGEAYYRLSLALSRQNKMGEAYQSLLHAVELNPGNVPAKIQLANLSLAAYAQDPKHPAAFYDRAVRITDQLLASDPNSADGLRLKGSIALLDNHAGEAAQLLRRALQASAGAPQIETELAEALLRDNQPAEGIQEARNVIAHHPDYGPAYDLLYGQYVGAQRWDEAESLLKQRISHQPKDASAIIRLAGFYVGRQRPDQAEKTLDTLVAKRDVFPQADLLAGDFHSLTRSFDKALADYQRGLSRDEPREKIYQVRSAGVLAVLGRRDEALKTIDAVLGKDPKDTTAQTLKVSILLEMGGAQNVKAAAALSTDLASGAQGNARIQMLTGQAAFSNREYDHAVTRFLQAAKIEPRSTAPRMALARVYLLRKNYSALLEQANTALAINNRDENARLYRIMALTGTGSYAVAKSEAEQMARSSSHGRQAQMQLGIIALSQKKYGEAQGYFQKLYHEGDQDVSPLAGLVSSLVAQNNSDKALALLAAQEKRTPESLPTEALTAATAQAAGKFDLALSELEKMASKTPDSVDVQIRIGQVEQKKGNYKAAIEAFERVHQLDPNRKGVDAVIGTLQDQSGDKTSAISSYRKALAELPDNPLVLNNLAYLLTETGGDLKEANRLATEGLRKAPRNPSVQDTLGWIEVQQGNFSAALPVFSSLTRENPDNAIFRYHFAVALLKSGDRAGAKLQLETALAKQPPQPVEKNIRALLAQAN